MNRLPSTDKLVTDAIEYTPDKIDAASWDHLLADASSATPFHNLGWIRSIYETYPSIKVRVLVVKDEDGYLGGFPYTIRKKYGFLQWLDSFLFGTYGGPILHNNASPEVSRVLWNSFQRITRSSIDAVRIRDFHNSLYLQHQGYRYRTVFTHRIPLHYDYDHIHKKIYTHNVRKMIRQSRDKGVYIEKVTTEEGVKEYAKCIPGFLPLILNFGTYVLTMHWSIMLFDGQSNMKRCGTTLGEGRQEIRILSTTRKALEQYDTITVYGSGILGS